MGIVALTMKASVMEMFLVLLVTGIHSNKEMTKKIKRPKFTVPPISCDVRAGTIVHPEFIVKCPAGCQDPKYHAYGTNVYASCSSVCAAAVHGGVLDNSGGKVLVQKVAGQPGYRGSYSNGVQSSPLPRWGESFVVSEGKPQKGVIYPSALTYSSAKTPAAKADEPTKAYQRPSVPGTTAQPVALLQVPGTAPAEGTHAASPKPSPSAGSASGSPRPQPGAHGSRQLGPWATASYTSSQNTDPGDPDAWRPGSVLLDAGFAPSEETSTRPLDPASQGDPACRVDLAFLIDGSASIGGRRFRLQKQFLADMAEALDVGPAGPLVGVVQYGDSPATQFNLKAHMNSRDLKAAVEKIAHRGGLSNVGRAISFVTKSFFSKASGNRGGAPNVAVVLVDGWPTDKVEEASRLARASGVNIFLVTVEGAGEREKPYVVEPNFASKAVCRTDGFYSLSVPSWPSLHRSVRPLATRVCEAGRLACSKTCLNSADVGFVIDGSSSVGTANFRTVLQFVANLSREFEISDTGTRVGAVQYTYGQRLEFGFEAHGTKPGVLGALRRVGYWSGGTSTGAAIRFALERLFQGSAPGKRKLMVLITDGRSYDDVRAPAMAARRMGGGDHVEALQSNL